LIKATKGRFDFSIRCKLAAPGLSEAFQHIRKVRRIYGFRLTVISRQNQHSASDFILRIRGQSTNRFKGLIEKFTHGG